MSKRIDIESLIEKANIPKQAMDIMLCHFLKRLQVAAALGAAPPRHHFRIVTCRKSFKMKNRVILISPKGKALCLLKTQFAKKPKNPV